MADGKNDNRALRVLEVVNDFRSLQTHITSVTTRPDASPPDQASASLPGYAVLRQCQAESQQLMSSPVNPGDLGIGAGGTPNTEEQKVSLLKVLLEVSCRRFRAHRIYLRTAAALRWVMMRRQVMSGSGTADKNRGLAAIDGRLREEIVNITDQHVYNELRNADQRKGYWLDDDPPLQRILAFIRTRG